MTALLRLRDGRFSTSCRDIVPDEDLSGWSRTTCRFREQLELDSMDFLDIVMELRKRYRIQIPEDDYVELASMASTVEYLEPLDEGTRRRFRVEPRCHRSASPDHVHVRHDHHRRGHVGPGGRHSPGYYDRRVCILERHTTIGGLNSFYRLAAATTTSACTPSPTSRPRARKRARLPRLLRQLRLSWDDFALAPQLGFGDRLSRRVDCEFSNDFELLRVRGRPRISRNRSTTSAGWLPSVIRLRRLGSPRVPLLRRAVVSANSSPTRCWSRCCSAR